MVTYSITSPTTWGLSNSPVRFIYNLISASASVSDLRFLGKLNYITDTTDGASVTTTQSVAAELSLPLRPDNKGVLDNQLLKSLFIQEVDPTTIFSKRLTNYIRYNLTAGFECNPNLTFSNVVNIGGKVGLSVGSTTSYRINDFIGIDLENKFINPQYDGYATISSFSSSNIVTTLNWGTTTSTTQSGSVYYLKRYNNGSTDRYLVEGALQYDDFTFNLDTQNYIFRQSGFNNKNFLTDYPTNYELSSNTRTLYIDRANETGQNETIFFLTDSFGDFKNIILNTYNSNFQVVATYSKQVWAGSPYPSNILIEAPNGSTSSSDSWKMFELGIGIPQFFSIAGLGDFEPPAFSSIFPTNVKYYSIRFESQNNTLSKAIYREAGCNPSPYENKQLLFKNRLGGWDYINFNQKNTKSINIERNNFKRPLDPTLSSYSGDDLRQDTTINVKYTEEYTASTDWMLESEYNYLNELLTSENIYIFENNILKPIQIRQTQFNYRTYQNQDLFILNITYTMAFDKLA